MKAEYYQEYYHLERENWWFLARKQILTDQVARIFNGRTDLKILNVGAALGASTIMLQRFGQVTSLEYDKSCCEFVKKELGMDFINGSITGLPFQSNEFDLVCAFDVVEHVQEDALAISELHRVCKPGGYTFTTVPTFKFLWSEHDEVNEHVRRYTMKNFLSLFDTKACSIYFKSYYNFWLFFPVAPVRILLSWLSKDKKKEAPKSDQERIKVGMFSKLLLAIFKSETYFLKKGIRFPTGISLMVITKKR